MTFLLQLQLSLYEKTEEKCTKRDIKVPFWIFFYIFSSVILQSFKDVKLGKEFELLSHDCKWWLEVFL